LVSEVSLASVFLFPSSTVFVFSSPILWAFSAALVFFRRGIAVAMGGGGRRKKEW
jgi:hypothetical protein